MPAIPLAGPDGGARYPRIESAGFQTAVFWIETDSEGADAIRGIVLKDATMRGTSFLPATRTIPSPKGMFASDLDLSLDPISHAPAIVWVASTDASSRVLYSSGNGEPQTIAESTNLLELPVVEFDEAGNAYSAWTRVSGGQSIVEAARLGNDGAWQPFSFSEIRRPYDVLPQFVRRPDSVDLYWYSLEESAVVARTATLGSSADSQPAVQTLGKLFTNRLPIVYRATAENLLGVFWLEQDGEVESYYVLDPRDKESADARRLTSATGFSAPRQVSVSDDQSAAFAWLETDNDKSQLLVATNPFGDTITLDVGRTATDPAISVSANWVHLIWIDENLSAHGALFYYRTR